MAAMASGESKDQVPDGWSKVPWVSKVNRRTLELEYVNRDKRVPMFEVGDIIKNVKENRSAQIVDRVRYEEAPTPETWYCLTRKYGKGARWFRESNLFMYTIYCGFYDLPENRALFNRNRPGVSEYLDPQLIKNNFDDLYEEGTRVSLVFNFTSERPGKAQLYYGRITKRMQKLAISKYVWVYTVTFDDGDVREYNKYRFAWLLYETARYFDTLSYADVDEYYGDDIPLALPGLKLRL